METTRDAAVPLVIAQGGASHEAPENTIAAFERALDDGADALAFAVHLSKDDHPVVIHDASLERTSDGRGPVRERTVRELKRLDAGGWRGRDYRGQRIQTLHEVLERFRDRTRFWIELGDPDPLSPGLEERVLSLVEAYDVVDGCLLQSFDPAALGRLLGFNRDIRLGALVDRPPVSVETAAGVARAICPRIDLLTEDAARSIGQAGLECYVWTVDEPALVDRLAGWRVSGMITRRPDVVRRRLGG